MRGKEKRAIRLLASVAFQMGEEGGERGGRLFRLSILFPNEGEKDPSQKKKRIERQPTYHQEWSLFR